MKEAVFKSLDDEVQQVQKFKEWYKYNTPNGRPLVGGDYLINNKEQFLLSISHDDDTLIATVLRQVKT